MEEFNNFKNDQINKLSLEIKMIENVLVGIEPNTEKYNEELNKIIVIKREIDILKKISYEQYNKNIKKYSDYLNKYGFINQLSPENMKNFIYLINLYKKVEDLNITQSIDIPESLDDLKDNFITNNINPSKVTDLNELNFMLKQTEDNYSSFLMKSNKILNIINSLNTAQLSILRSDYMSNKIPRKSNLEYFRMFGEDHIIDLIESNIDILNNDEKKVIKTESLRKNIIRTKRNIQNYVEHLLKHIYFYINYILKDYNEFIQLDENDILNIRNIIYKVNCKVSSLTNDYKKLISEIKNKLLIKNTIVRSENKNHKNIEISISSLVLGYSFHIDDLKDLDETKLNEVIAKNNVYDKILNKSFENNLKLQ